MIKYGGWRPVFPSPEITHRTAKVLLPQWQPFPHYSVEDRLWKSQGFVPLLSGGIDYLSHPSFEGIGDNGPFIENGHLSPDFSNGLGRYNK